MNDLLKALHDLKNVIECNRWYIEQNIPDPLRTYDLELEAVLKEYDKIIIEKVNKTFLGKGKEVSLQNCPPVSEDCIYLDGEWDGYVSELLAAEVETGLPDYRLKYSETDPDILWNEHCDGKEI